MSILIDKFVIEHSFTTPTHSIDDKWFIAKPLTSNNIKDYFNRLKDAIRVIRGKSIAVHYKIDEK